MVAVNYHHFLMIDVHRVQMAAYNFTSSDDALDVVNREDMWRRRIVGTRK